MHTQDGAHKRRYVATARVFSVNGVVGLFPPSSEASRSPHTQGGAYTRQCTYKAVYTQGDAHKRRSVATTRVFLFKGGAGESPASTEASCSARTRRCIHKAVHTRSGWSPPWESCYLRGLRGCPPHRAKRAGVHIQGGAYTRRCTYKAQETKGGVEPMQESCCLRGVRGVPRIESSGP